MNLNIDWDKLLLPDVPENKQHTIQQRLLEIYCQTSNIMAPQ